VGPPKRLGSLDRRVRGDDPVEADRFGQLDHVGDGLFVKVRRELHEEGLGPGIGQRGEDAFEGLPVL
jgi:hypothetical protein